MAVTLLTIASPTTALANFAIHGNYVADADVCEHCHRAHTPASSITWTSGTEQKSALLVGSATQMSEFCYACHDATGQGADTNVQEGVYEGTLYGVQGAPLNGGGLEFMPVFDESLNATVSAPVTSEHEFRGSSWGAFGGGYDDGSSAADGMVADGQAGESVDIKMDCATCHDPHGSPNYRILRSQVNGNQVGEYVGSGTDPDPDGWVASVEEGWPAGGFRLHTAYPKYKPDYTTPRYAKGYDMRTGKENPTKGMSGWCDGCHGVNVGEAVRQAESDGAVFTASAPQDVDGGPGGEVRHRHSVNVPLSNFRGARAGSLQAADVPLPLAHELDAAESGNDRGNQDSDWIECLTCHRAHGTVATMSGGGTSALLRENNRGVCQSYHNR